MSLPFLRRAVIAAAVALVIAVGVICTAIGGDHSHGPGHRAVSTRDQDRDAMHRLVARIGDRMGLIRVHGAALSG